jgi:ornithine--oxo-acid transaminase
MSTTSIHTNAGYISQLIRNHCGEQFDLHLQYMNPQTIKVLKTIGYDRTYVNAQGPYLWDDIGDRYLDLISGWGAVALGRNHPTVNAALREVLDLALPNLGQMDASLLSGLLAKELLQTVPGRFLDKVFFTNSGAEAVEGALKFARAATGRNGFIFCDHAFHGLSLGALSLNGDAHFRDGFGDLLPHCTRIPYNDLQALERALHGKTMAAFVVEPIQGKGVNMPEAAYLKEAAQLCRQHGTLFIADEIQTGLGRTGKMWAIEHWGVEPDIMTCAKTLSGGQVPVGAILTRKAIFQAVFNTMERSVVHSSTFGQNNLAMAAGLATLKVLREDHLVAHVAELGERLLDDFRAFVSRYEFVKDVRGKGLMIGIELGKPQSLKLKAAWTMLAAASDSLFPQMILIPLFKKHRILAQVAGHGLHVIKLLPAYVISEADRLHMVSAFDAVLADCHKVSGAIWELSTNLASHAWASR